MSRAKSKIKQGRPPWSRKSKIHDSLSASGGEGQGDVVPIRQSKIHWERILLIHQRIKTGSCPSTPASLPNSKPPSAVSSATSNYEKQNGLINTSFPATSPSCEFVEFVSSSQIAFFVHFVSFC
jgi:hypothetical protein